MGSWLSERVELSNGEISETVKRCFLRCERCAFWRKNPTSSYDKGACSHHMRAASRLGSCREFVASDKNFLRIVLDTLVADGQLVKVWRDGAWCYGRSSDGQ